MTTSSSATETVDLDRLEVDVKENIGRLRECRGRLALDAISDPEVRAELEDVERELAAAEAELGRVDLARAEQARRETERQQQELDERQAAALVEARRLQGERHVAAVRIDREAGKLLQSVATYFEACSEQQRALNDAGQGRVAGAARPRSFLVEAALAFQMRQVQLPGDFLSRFPVIGAHAALLADADPTIANYLGAEQNDDCG